MTENSLADAVAEQWVAAVLALVAVEETPETTAAINRLQAALDEWEILRVAAVRRAILRRLEAAQMGRVLALINAQQLTPPDSDRSN